MGNKAEFINVSAGMKRDIMLCLRHVSSFPGGSYEGIQGQNSAAIKSLQRHSLSSISRLEWVPTKLVYEARDAAWLIVPIT